MRTGIGRVGLRILAMASLAAGAIAGGLLARMRGRVPFTAGDCMPPRGYVGGGYRCYTIGHPHVAIAVLIIVIGIVTFALFWLLSTRLSTDPTPAAGAEAR